MIDVGAAIVDITPPLGLAMAGFAARTHPATAVHDALTVRALVVRSSALVTVDVIGIDAALSARVRKRCPLSDDAVMIVATHTHGGPASMPDRLWVASDPAFMDRLEDSIVQAIRLATEAQQPARLFGGTGADPGHAMNRREAGGPVDRNIPVLRFENAQGNAIALLTSYACHPVVLGADNVEWTADYPHFTREFLESVYPGAIAIFATGCAGDVNTGHSAASSLSNKPKADRSFSRARTIGNDVAQSVLNAEMIELAGGLGVANVVEEIDFQQREKGSQRELSERWRTQAASGDCIAQIWADWAESVMGKQLHALPTRCTAFNWCGAQIVAMPGEIFAQTALDIRQSLTSPAPLFVLAYADDNPGYVPPSSAFSKGGYEVDEAHRFYGMGATFAPGSAERLATAGCKAARMAASRAKDDLSINDIATEGSM